MWVATASRTPTVWTAIPAIRTPGSAWPVLLAAQKQGRFATTGAYGHVRHPQYVGFIVIMLGFLLQWPTILTLTMFPFLVLMYVHLAHAEEAEPVRGEALQRTSQCFRRHMPDAGSCGYAAEARVRKERDLFAERQELQRGGELIGLLHP